MTTTVSARPDEIVDLMPGLFGVLSRPTTASRKTCVVIFNAGFLPRSGAFRLHVRLSRHLAALGYPTVRFDLFGIGDTLPYADRPPSDIVRHVFDRLEALTGCSTFVTGGVCSAADLGWQVAVVDPRVAGVISIDGMVRKTFAYTLGRLRRSLGKSPSEWFATVARAVRRRPASAVSHEPENLREWPEPGTERGQLEALLGRNTELYWLFTGGASYFLDRRQFQQTFGSAVRSERVLFRHWPHCDHLFYAAASRSRLIADLGEWLQRRLPD